MRFPPGPVHSARLVSFLLAAVFVVGFARPARAQSSWQVKTPPSTSSLNAVAFGAGLFVAIGENGTIVTSPDGEVWTPRASGTTDRLSSIAFGNGRFVATRANRNVPAITSPDGINWTPVTLTDASGAPATSGAYGGIAFGAGRFLAIGSFYSYSSGEVMTSNDGISFRTVVPARYPEADPLEEALTSVMFFAGRFYGYAQYGGFFETVDGVHWKSRGDWGGYYFGVAAGDGGRQLAIFTGFDSRFSQDAGHTFLHALQPEDRYEIPNGTTQTMPNIVAMCYGAGSFVGVDTSGRTWTSDRGEFWLPRGRQAKAGEAFRGVAFDGVSRFVAVGSAPESGPPLVAIALADPPRPVPPGYTIYSLKELTNGAFDGLARNITNSGIIAGDALRPAGQKVAVVLRDGVVTTYPDPVFGSRTTWANAVNDSGQAACEILVSSGYSALLLAYASPAQVQTLPYSGNTTAPSINSTGWIVGTYNDPTHNRHGIYRYNSNTGEAIDLGDLGLTQIAATSINDQGDIVGTYVYGTDPQLGSDKVGPFRLRANGELSPIPTLGGGWVSTVFTNSVGDVAGSSSLPSAPAIVNIGHAFLHQNGVTSDIDLFNSRESIALGMNNKADVVGRFYAANMAPWQSQIGNAFLYHAGAMYDLNWLLDGSGDGWVLHRATSINDKGWIVGEGWHHGFRNMQPFLAIPSGGTPVGVRTRFVNVSTRLRTGIGDDVLIGGFNIRGGPKMVGLRAMGPALGAYGNPNNPGNLLPDPTLELFNAAGERIAFNDNYTDLPYNPDRNDIGLYGLAPSNGASVVRDSVIITMLPEGSYTAVVRGKDGVTGNCLVEVYNLDTDYTEGLVNISTRGPVGTGEDVMIAGFIIRGEQERRVLIRGMGPSLSASGVANPLQDPTLEIHDQNGQIAQNDSWRSDQRADIESSGLAPTDDREAAVILSLWPGSYTAILRGKDNATGNALIEVYALP